MPLGGGIRSPFYQINFLETLKLLQEAVRRRNFLAKEVTAAAEPLTVYLKGGSNKKRSLTIVLRVCAIHRIHLDLGRIRAITHISQGGGIVTAQTQEKGDEIP